LAALISGVIVIDAALWLSDLFERSAWLGVVGTLLIGGVSVALADSSSGEYRNLMRLRTAQSIREQGYHLAEASNRFEGHGFMSDLVRLTASSRPDACSASNIATPSPTPMTTARPCSCSSASCCARSTRSPMRRSDGPRATPPSVPRSAPSSASMR
jgi:hypothetical protein